MLAQLETTARATDATHLELETPLADVLSGQRMKVLITFEPLPENPRTPVDFRSAIGSYYRDFPQKPSQSTDEYMRTQRDGGAV